MVLHLIFRLVAREVSNNGIYHAIRDELETSTFRLPLDVKKGEVRAFLTQGRHLSGTLRQATSIPDPTPVKESRIVLLF